MELDDELEAIKETGDAWHNRWWLNPQWRKFVELPHAELDALCNILYETFDSKWIESLGDKLGEHPLIQDITFGKSRHQLMHLVNLADDIQQLRELTGFKRVLDDYKFIQTARSARLELFFAAVMKRVGYEVSFIVPKPKKGKTPDILVSNGESEFVIECKFVRDAKSEVWFDNYSMEFSSSIIRMMPKGISYWYNPSAPPVDIRQYRRSNSLMSPKLAAIMDTLAVTRSITEFTHSFQMSVVKEIPGKGKLFLTKDPEQYFGTIHLPEMNRDFLLYRLVNNGLEKANDQIRTYGKPGIAVIFYSGVRNLGLIERDFNELIDEDPEKYRHLMGMLMLPMQNILQYIHPYWLSNSRSDFSAEEMGITDKIDEQFMPIGLEGYKNMPQM